MKEAIDAMIEIYDRMFKFAEESPYWINVRDWFSTQIYAYVIRNDYGSLEYAIKRFQGIAESRAKKIGKEKKEEFRDMIEWHKRESEKEKK